MQEKVIDDQQVSFCQLSDFLLVFVIRWDAGTQRYAYAFRLQGPVIDEDSKTIAAEYRESAALSWRDVYEWQNDELTLVSHEALSE